MLPDMSFLRGIFVRSFACFCLLVVLVGGARAADTLPSPEGTVVLSVTGRIGVTNAEGRADFDLAMLGQLPQHEFNTLTPWTTQVHRYRGVLLRDLLDRVGAEGERVRATALNQYHADLPPGVASDYPLLLATHRDGEPMRVRDKGPIWILLPLSDHPELNLKQHHEMMVWQLRTLDIR
ncbi:putative pterin-binding protein [Zobellella denitrificans]